MIIRRFQEEDAEEVSKIMKENFLKINSKEYSEKTLKALIKDSTPKRIIEKAKKRNYYVAIDNNKIIGIGGYEKDQIHTFFVKPEAHGKGVGKELMKKVLEDAKKEGIKKMYSASTKYAEKFYEKMGFKKIEEKTTPFYDSQLEFVLMKKEL